MREYRGKRKSNGKWVYGFLSEEDVIQHPLTNINPNASLSLMESFSVIPETVGQYTGFEDVNSIIIFDGDILKNLCTEEIGQVAMCEGCWMIISGAREIDFLNNWILDEESEIIGNIYDTPELLKEAKT